jgi:cation transport regulator
MKLTEINNPELPYRYKDRQPPRILARAAGPCDMPYETNADLPASVRCHLPAHAQDIFRAAFNRAFASYLDDPRREEIAYRIAWAAVKRAYVKVGERWVAKAGLGRTSAAAY